MGLSQKQIEAVESRIDQDVLVSAGAGSGKTFTLTEKILQMITNEVVRPDELLVLTFTNNAAHEMKERIIARFFKALNEKIASAASSEEIDKYRQYLSEMESCHIQTFDSFAQYVVSKYAVQLGIYPSFSIIDATILNEKKAALIDEVFLSFYQDSEKRERLLNTLIKVSSNDDVTLKKAVLDFADNLAALLPNKKEDVLNRYQEIFLSKDEYIKRRDREIIREKEMIKAAICKQDFNAENFKTPLETMESLSSRISFYRTRSFSLDADSFNLPSKKTTIGELMADLFSLLSCENDEFYDEAEKIKRKYKGKRIGELSTLLNGLNAIGYSSRDYSVLLSFSNDVELMIDLEKEYEKRLWEYKKSVNAYTFQDISLLLVKLFEDDSLKDCADEIRNAFTYIMVDEYQDTNDIQEVFLEAMIKPKKVSGSKIIRSHLFCVGDPKQSIYRFRNSKVELFINRRKKYLELHDDEHLVIDMNENYRSLPGLISDINHLFNSYMTVEHGSIAYQEEENQLLIPTSSQVEDERVDFEANKSSYTPGVYRLIVDSKQVVDECKAIALDIKNKMNSENFFVFERGKKRRARWSDFVILCRKSKDFDKFISIFQSEGIPLNNTTKNDFKENLSVIAVQSLLKIIDGIVNKKPVDTPHYLLSLMRSYLYEYSDEECHKFIKACKENRIMEIKENSVYQQILAFVKKHSDERFDQIYIALIEEFSIVTKLYKIGRIQENTAKLDSLYSIVIAQEEMGLGMEEFVNLFTKIKTRGLTWEDAVLVKMSDAVELMTIHASKGLQWPIVYLPFNSNKKAKQQKVVRPVVKFTPEFGLIFDDYSLDSNSDMEHNCYTSSRILDDLNDDKAESNEHTRLFYVAFTRAQQLVIITGRDASSERITAFYSDGKNNNISRETLYGVYDATYGRFEVDKCISCTPYFEKKKELSFLKLVNNYMSNKGEDYISIFINDVCNSAISLYYKMSYERLLDKLISSLNALQYTKDNASKVLFGVDYASLKRKHDEEKTRMEGELAVLKELEKRGNAVLIYTEKEHLKSLDFYHPEKGASESEAFSPVAKKWRANYNLLFLASHKFDCINALEKFDEKKTYYIDMNYYQNDKLAFLDDQEGGEEYLINGFKAMKYEIDKLSEFKGKKLLTAKRRIAETYACNLYSLSPSSLVKQSYQDEEFFDLNYHSDILASADTLDLDENSDFESDETEPDDEDVDMDTVIASSKKWSEDDFNKCEVSDAEIHFPVVEKKRASMRLVEDDNEDLEEILERGTMLHKCLELVSFTTRDTSFIPDFNARKMIDSLLKLEIFNGVREEDVKKEYQYYDEEYQTSGSIDLVIVQNGKVKIVDYKTANIDKVEYRDQLLTYRRNYSRINGIPESDIEMYLLSLTRRELKEIQ